MKTLALLSLLFPLVAFAADPVIRVESTSLVLAAETLEGVNNVPRPDGVVGYATTRQGIPVWLYGTKQSFDKRNGSFVVTLEQKQLPALDLLMATGNFRFAIKHPDGAAFGLSRPAGGVPAAAFVDNKQLAFLDGLQSFRIIDGKFVVQTRNGRLQFDGKRLEPLK